MVSTCSFPSVQSTSHHEQENFKKPQLSLIDTNGKYDTLGPINSSTSFRVDEVGIASVATMMYHVTSPVKDYAWYDKTELYVIIL